MEWSLVPQNNSFAVENVDPFCYILPLRRWTSCWPRHRTGKFNSERILEEVLGGEVGCCQPAEVVARPFDGCRCLACV